MTENNQNPDPRRWCPFDEFGRCGLDFSTGKKMSSEDIADNDAPCGFPDKTECSWRRRFDPVMAPKTRPGACIADAISTECKIIRREESIAILKTRIAQDEEKIQIMTHEIAEMRAGRMT